MAAPSGITWGDIVGGYGRIGIYIGLTNTNTQTKVNVQVWFWSKYSVSDTSNSYYYNNNATSATTRIGSKSINTTVSSGSGWSTSNQVKLGEANYTFDRGTSAVTKNCAAKLTGIEAVGGTMTHKRSYTIPALTKYTVSYNANGGSGAPSSQTKYYGKALTLSTTKPTRTGYTFKGWSLEKGGSVYYTAGSSCGKNENLTLYAVWQENTLTVNYYSNYATYCELDVAVSASTNVKVHSQTFSYATAYSNGLSDYTSASGAVHMTRTGYTGTGKWNTAKDGSGTSVDEGTSFTTGQKVAEAFGKSLKTGNASVNVYAQWEINTYAVKYNANGGSGAPAEQTKTYGKALTLRTAIPTRTGYTFKCWNQKSDGSGETNFSPGGTYTGNHDATFYAIWEKSKYTVTIDPNGGYRVSDGKTGVHTYSHTYQNSENIIERRRDGYTLTGYTMKNTSSGSTTDLGGATFTFDDSTKTGVFVQGSVPITLTAQWKINQYKLTVNPNNGTWNGSTEAQEFTQNYGTVKNIPVPVWTGHTFTGWTFSGYGSLSKLGAVATDYTFKAGNGTLKAKWDTNEYFVVFDAGTNEGLMPSGIESEMASIEYGTAIGALPIAERRNYSFLGWFTAPTGGTQITSSYVITENITLYAQYEIDASAYVNDEGTWRPGVVFAKDEENQMRKGYVKVNDNGTWKDAYCK